MTHSGSCEIGGWNCTSKSGLKGSPNQQMQTTIYISIKWINNEVLLYSIGNYSQYTINHNGEGLPVGPFLRLCFPVQGLGSIPGQEKGKRHPLQYSVDPWSGTESDTTE